MPLILASRSPQRRAILEQLGVAFAVRVPDVEELDGGSAARGRGRERLPQGGGGRAGARPDDAVVLGVDTVVALGARIYGKPADAARRAATLRALARPPRTR